MKHTSLDEALRQVERDNPVCARCGAKITGSYAGAGDLCEDCSVNNWVRFKCRGRAVQVSRQFLTVSEKHE